MSIVLVGSTSGSVTLQEPAVAGTTVIDLPATSGTMVVTGGAQTVQFAAGTSSAPSITFTGDTNTGIFSPGADTIAFTEGGVEAMRIDSSANLNMSTVGGKVNFATTSSSTVNYIGVPADGFSLEMACQRGGSQPFVYKQDFANGHIWSSSGTERMRIDTSGQLGINTTTPADRLTVNGNIALNGGLNYVFANGGGGGGTVNAGFGLDGTNSRLLFYTGGVGNERMRITSGGDFYVGTTTGTIDSSNKGFAISGDGEVRLSRLVGGSSPVFNIWGSQGQARMMGNGNLQNTNNSYGAISDVKLKENIVDATPKLEKLNQVRVVNYNLIGSEQKQIGVIAQELEQVFPNMVEEVQDRDADGNDLGTTTKSVKYSIFVPMLIKAIQEQQAIITDLKARIETLENK